MLLLLVLGGWLVAACAAAALLSALFRGARAGGPVQEHRAYGAVVPAPRESAEQAVAEQALAEQAVRIG